MKVLPILTWALAGSDRSGSIPPPLTLGKQPPYQLERRLCGSQIRPGRWGQTIYSCYGESNPSHPSRSLVVTPTELSLIYDKRIRSDKLWVRETKLTWIIARYHPNKFSGETEENQDTFSLSSRPVPQEQWVMLTSQETDEATLRVVLHMRLTLI